MQVSSGKLAAGRYSRCLTAVAAILGPHCKGCAYFPRLNEQQSADESSYIPNASAAPCGWTRTQAKRGWKA